MCWTFLDYCLLTCAVLSGLLIPQHAFAPPNCQYNLCAPEKIYGFKHAQGVDHYEWDQLDCRECKRATGLCDWGPWGANCVINNDVNQRHRGLASAQLKCSGVNGDYIEAWSDSGGEASPWLNAGKQKWCQDPPLE